MLPPSHVTFLLGCHGLGVSLRLGSIIATLLGQSESGLGIFEIGVWEDMSPFMNGGAGRQEWKPFTGREQSMVGGKATNI